MGVKSLYTEVIKEDNTTSFTIDNIDPLSLNSIQTFKNNEEQAQLKYTVAIVDNIATVSINDEVKKDDIITVIFSWD